MRVLVACEESQRVCIAFRERGHEAYSCDIIECSGGHPEWHGTGGLTMREILFRGKRADNGEWVYGDVWHNYDNEPRCIKDYCGGNPVDPATVGQYTGKKDKNGKMIFEGDIVDAAAAWWDAAGPAGHESPIITVEWNDLNCGVDPFADYDCDCGVFIMGEECEVIGNIHDNPELLKGDNDG